MSRALWIGEASDDEKGSFCDTDSGNHYNNVDAFGAISAQKDAESDDRKVVCLDEPVDDQTVSGGVDQRYNLHYTENDSSGVPQTQKLGPGC